MSLIQEALNKTSALRKPEKVFTPKLSVTTQKVVMQETDLEKKLRDIQAGQKRRMALSWIRVLFVLLLIGAGVGFYYSVNLPKQIPSEAPEIVTPKAILPVEVPLPVSKPSPTEEVKTKAIIIAPAKEEQALFSSQIEVKPMEKVKIAFEEEMIVTEETSLAATLFPEPSVATQPEFKLTGITSFFGENPSAIINNELVEVGSELSGEATVLSIQTTFVILEIQGEELQLSL